MLQDTLGVLVDLTDYMFKTIRRYIAYLRLPPRNPDIWFKNEWRSSHIDTAVYGHQSPQDLVFTLDTVVVVWFKENVIYFNDEVTRMPLSEFLKVRTHSPKSKIQPHLFPAKMHDLLAKRYKEWQESEMEKILLGDNA